MTFHFHANELEIANTFLSRGYALQKHTSKQDSDK